MGRAPRRTKRRANATCPCGSGRPYGGCCGRFHEGAEPPSATALMRSRYTAFVRGDFTYLWRTLHEGHDDRRQERDAWIASAEEHASRNDYRRLTILDADGEGDTARVLFHVALRRDGEDASFAELSHFAHDGVGWRYLDGVLLPRSALPGRLAEMTIAAFAELRA